MPASQDLMMFKLKSCFTLYGVMVFLNWSIFLSLFAYLGVFFITSSFGDGNGGAGEKSIFFSIIIFMMFTQYNIVDTKGKLSIEFIQFKKMVFMRGPL